MKEAGKAIPKAAASALDDTCRPTPSSCCGCFCVFLLPALSEVGSPPLRMGSPYVKCLLQGCDHKALATVIGQARLPTSPADSDLVQEALDFALTPAILCDCKS